MSYSDTNKHGLRRIPRKQRVEEPALPTSEQLLSRISIICFQQAIDLSRPLDGWGLASDVVSKQADYLLSRMP